MSVRTVPKEQLLRLLEARTLDPLVARCVTAVKQDARTVFTTGSTAARSLRESLELKMASAGRAGTVVEGGSDLLLVLQALGDTPIQVFGIEDGDEVVAIYASVDRELVAGCLILER